MERASLLVCACVAMLACLEWLAPAWLWGAGAFGARRARACASRARSSRTLVALVFVLVFAAQKKPGDDGFLAPAKKNGKFVVMMPKALVGVLLEMVSGSELTPKGGLDKMLMAHEKEEELPKPSGKFGSGAYKDD